MEHQLNQSDTLAGSECNSPPTGEEAREGDAGADGGADLRGDAVALAVDVGQGQHQLVVDVVRQRHAVDDQRQAEG
jgi:hypothetical protein